MISQVKKNESRKRKVTDSTTKIKSACKRCRSKKIKCDQEFPSCRNCSKANEPCVSLDPVTGEDVPRSYLLFLESRVAVMAKKLRECGVDISSIRNNIPSVATDKPYDLDYDREMNSGDYSLNRILGNYLIQRGEMLKGKSTVSDLNSKIKPAQEFKRNISTSYTASNDNGSSGDGDKIDGINNNNNSDKFPYTSPTSVLNTNSSQFNILQPDKDMGQFQDINSNSTGSFLGDSSGIPFAKLVFAAASFSPEIINDDLDIDIERREAELKYYRIADTTDNFDPLWLPSKKEAEDLVVKFFTDTNSQLPIFHREHFLKKYFEPIYGLWNTNISLISEHTRINTDFKLPADIYVAPDEKMDYNIDLTIPWFDTLGRLRQNNMHKDNNISVPSRFKIPLFFLNTVFSIGHATRVLESNITTLVTFKRRALYFRSALFNSIDKLETLAGTLLIVLYSLMRPSSPGVWYVMGSALRLTVDLGLHDEKLNQSYNPFQREIRRRLFWCAYSLDRQICSYFGRPFGIPEESITTRFPSLLDDSNIVPILDKSMDYSDNLSSTVSSKVIANAMYKIRKIQGNIVKILYAPRSELPRKYSDLDNWKEYVLDELNHWYKSEVPKSFDTMNCKFNTFFFDLNYYYSKTILFGISPKTPILNERAFKIVKESTKGTIDVFDGLCMTKKMSYTWVATHNIFMTGMTYLYVIYYHFGKNDSKDDVINYVEKVLNVLKNLIGTCDAAKNCYRTYKMLCAAVIKLKFGDVYGSSMANRIKKTKFSKKKLKRSRKSEKSSNIDLKDHEAVYTDEKNNTCMSKEAYPSVSAPVVTSDVLNITGSTSTNPIFTDPLDQFFNDLNKLNKFFNTEESVSHIQQQKQQQTSIPTQIQTTSSKNHTLLKEPQGVYKVEIDPLTYQHTASDNSGKGLELPSLETTVKFHRRPSNIIDKDIGDLLYQVTSQSIWDGLFGNQADSANEINGSLNTTSISQIHESLSNNGKYNIPTPGFGDMELF